MAKIAMPEANGNGVNIAKLNINIMTVIGWFVTVVPIIVGIIMWTNVQFTRVEKDRADLEKQLTAEIANIKLSVTGMDTVIATIKEQAQNQTAMLVQLGQMTLQIKTLQEGQATARQDFNTGMDDLKSRIEKK